MKNRKKLKSLSLFLAVVMIVLSLPMNVFATTVESVDEGTATTQVNGLKDYSMPSNEKHAYDPFAQLENEEATKEYRETVQYVAGSIIYKVNETKGWIGGYKDQADGDSLTAMGIDISSAEELSRKRVDNGFFKDTYEVIYVAELDGDVWETVDALAETEGVVDAQPNYLYEDTAIDVPTEVSKNPGKGNQWHHDWLNMYDRWNDLFEQGITAGEGSIVAVIDTGVDYTHNDLAANMWVNTAELNGKAGVDDDGNGYVDDIYGVSTVGATKYHSGDPMDDHGHGTHVAGIIAMTANNYEGGVGVSYGTKVMAIKAGQATGVFADTDIAEAINYAVAMGADVINMSFGGTGKSFLVEEALANAFGSCVLVAAAGNDGLPTADAPDDFMKKADFYPAGYSYVLGVMATDQDGNLASFSNWDYYNNGGSAEYEITAPGVDIWSTLPGNQYAAWDGTSMACPMVAAAAALIRSKYSDTTIYSSRFIMGQLASATDLSTNYVDKIGEVHTYGALDIESSLNDLPTPNITLKNTYLFDDPAIAPENDGDGIIDAGETIDLGLVLRNQWGMAGDVTVTVDAISVGGVANPNIEWITDTITMEDIGTFNEQNNSFVYEEDMLVGTDNPIRFKVKSDTINDANIGFNITITCSNALDKEDNTVYETEDGLSFYVQRGRSLSGTIRENMTLTSADYWIIENSVYIPEGITVTVEPGTQVQFWPSDDNNTAVVYIQVDGTFHVNGTEESPVEMFPSSAFEHFGVDIRGGIKINNTALHPNAQTVGESKLSYVNIINPLLNFNYGDHLYIVQNSQEIYYRNINGATRNDSAMLVTQKLCDSIVKNCHILNFAGRYEQVVFEGLDASDTKYVSFENCTFIEKNSFTNSYFLQKFGLGITSTSNSPLVYRMPRLQLSIVGAYNGSKYVLVEGTAAYFLFDVFNVQGSTADKMYCLKYHVANTLAANRGGYLASLNDAEEFSVVKKLISDIAPNDNITLGGYIPAGSETVLLADGTLYYETVGASDTDKWMNWSNSVRWISFTEPVYGNMLFEYPESVSDESILASFTQAEWEVAIKDNVQYHSFGYISAFEGNAILSSLYDSNVDSQTRLQTDISNEYLIFAQNNYFGTENEKLIQSMIIDGDTRAGIADIVTTPYLTLESPELETIYPFVTEAYITDAEGNRITSASKGQEIQIHVKFNRDMNTSVQPMVSFGPAEPYTDYVVDGDFVSAREWVATTKVSGFVDAGTEYIRIKDAQAADDAWLKTGTDAARFAFEINTTGAEALTLQAVGGENKIELSWTQDDYDTLAGFNVYRSNKADGTFTKINSRLIPGTIREYVDTDVEPGKEYFYYFTVMGTDLQESPASNISAATPIDNIKPIVTHTRVTYGSAGQALSFNVTATDNIGVEYVKIFYRTQGASNWSVLNLSNTEGSKYYGVITAKNVTPAGLEYYLEVSDGTSVVRDGSAVAPIKITVDNSLAIYSVTPYKVDTGAVAEGITAILTGVNFTDTMTLKVAGKQVEYTFISSSQISFTIPTGNIGRCDVQLIDGDRFAQLTNAFSYTDGNSEAQITAPDEVKSRETVKLPIYVTAEGNVISLDIQMKLTKSLYSSVKFEKSSALGSAYAQFSCNYYGVAKLVVSSTTALDLSQPIGYLVLTPTNTTEPVAASVELTSVLANAVAVDTLIDCNFEIKPNFTLSGKITYYAGGAGIPGVKVTLNNGMVTYTDANGVYTFTGITTNHVVVTPHLNGLVNGAITSTDASDILVDLVADSSSLTDFQRIAADVDGDGIITAHDAAYILQKSAGIIEGNFPGIGAEWVFEGTMVASLTGDKSNMDFTGILLGDVTGDWKAVSEEMD